MKVLYVSKAMIVTAYRDKLRALAERVELEAAVPERWGQLRLDAAPEHEPWLRPVVARGHGHNHLHVYRNARRFVPGSAADLVHIDEEPYSAVTAQLARACRTCGVPFVFFAWQNLPKRIPAPFRALRRYVFSRAAGGIAGTEAAASVLRGWGYGGPLAVIPQIGVDTDRFRPDPARRAAMRARLDACESDFVVGFGGRLVPEKGVHVLLEAAAGLPGARLLFMGDGPERTGLERNAMRAGMAARTYFTGGVPSTSVAQWLPACDVLVLPSLTARNWAEQFGRILVEAMACGIAVVGSDSGEIRGVVGDGGLIVPEGDVAALRSALCDLARDPESRRQLAERGHRRTVERYTNRCIAERTVTFYRAVAGPGVTS